MEKAQNHARRRAIEKAMEQEGEVEMTGELGLGGWNAVTDWNFADAPKTTKAKAKPEKSTEDKMDVDAIS